MLFGKYKIISSLGRGGFSQVLLVRHIQLDCLRAVKVISKGNHLHDRLINEACILKSLNHECIPTIYDIEEDEENSYIIEEYCKGISLLKERLSWEKSDMFKVVDYSIQICSLIDYLHNGGRKILYLDLKPQNLIVSNGRIMLIDFGNAILQSEVKDMQFCMGTKGYAAPEQYDVNQRPDMRSDIYSIGCIIRFLKYGADNGTASKECRQIKVPDNKTDGKLLWSREGIKPRTDEVDNIIDRCLRDNPNERYSSVKEVIVDLNTAKKSKAKSLVDVMKKGVRSTYRDKCVWYKKSIAIAVAGTHKGVGVTSLVMMLGDFFQTHLKKKTVVVDMSEDMDITNMVKADVNNEVTNKINYVGKEEFSINFIKYKKDYEVVIIDFGCLKADNVNEFNQSWNKLIVTSIDEWKINRLFEFLDRFSSFDKASSWIYVVNKGYKDKIKKIKDYYGINIECMESYDKKDNYLKKIIPFLEKIMRRMT